MEVGRDQSREGTHIDGREEGSEIKKKRVGERERHQEVMQILRRWQKPADSS